MHRPRANPFYSGLITALVLFVVMCGVFISGIPAGPQISLPWNPVMTLHVQLANADALAPHASVEIGGVKVGEVQSVAGQGDISVATLQIQERYSDVHRDATVYLRAHGLFGPKYIAIVPGTTSAPALHDGDTITVNQTVQPVDLDAILQDLQAPEQQNLRTFIVELGQAAAGKGDEVNHLFAAANNLTHSLDTPVKAIDQVAPQLSDMLVKDEAFNAYFAQTPLDQLVANSETTIQAFASNASHLESLLIHADSTLGQLETALGGQAGNIQTIVQDLGKPGGTIDRLNTFTYLLSLFGANLTGHEPGNPADQDVAAGIIGAIKNVASAFYYSDPCAAGASLPSQLSPLSPVTGPVTSNAPSGGNHCAASSMYLDGRQHFLHVRTFNFAPTIPNLPPIPGLPQICIPILLPPLPIQLPVPVQLPQQPICISTGIADRSSPGPALNAGDELNGFGSFLAS